MTHDHNSAWSEFVDALATALKIPQIVDWLANEIGWISNLSDAQINMKLAREEWDKMSVWERDSIGVSAFLVSRIIEPYKGEPY